MSATPLYDQFLSLRARADATAVERHVILSRPELDALCAEMATKQLLVTADGVATEGRLLDCKVTVE